MSGGSVDVRPMGAGRASAWFWFALALVTLGGLGLRLGYIAADRWDVVPQGDGLYYHTTANQLADGDGIVNPFLREEHGIDQPAADHPPLYTMYLAVFSAVGLDSSNDHVVATALLGAATIFLSGLIGLRIGGPRVGVLAAVLVAVYPNVWRHDAVLMSESIAIMTTALTVWLAYRYLARPTMPAIALVGAAVGLATLARSELILYALFLVVPLVIVGTRRTDTARSLTRDRLGQLTVAGLCCAALVVPWVVRNWVQVGRPMLSSQLEVTLATANCDSTYYGQLIGYWDLYCVGPIREEAGVEDPRDPRFDTVLGEGARSFIGDNAGAVPRVVAARVGRTLTVYEPDQTVILERWIEAGDEWVARLGMWTFRVAIVTGLVGAVVLRRRRVPVFPLLAPLVTVLVTVVLLYSTVRFRAPADLMLAILTAVTLDQLWRWLRSRVRQRDDEHRSDDGSAHNGLEPPPDDTLVPTSA